MAALEDTLHRTLIGKSGLKIFRQAVARKAAIDAGLSEEEVKDETASLVRKLINVKAPPATEKSKEGRVSRVHDETRLVSGKFFIYKYDPNGRYAGKPSPPEGKTDGEVSAEVREIPIPKLRFRRRSKRGKRILLPK